MCARACVCVQRGGAGAGRFVRLPVLGLSLFFIRLPGWVFLFLFFIRLSVLCLCLCFVKIKEQEVLFFSLSKKRSSFSLSLVMSFCLFISLVPLHSRPWSAATERGSAWTVAALRVTERQTLRCPRSVTERRNGNRGVAEVRGEATHRGGAHPIPRGTWGTGPAEAGRRRRLDGGSLRVHLHLASMCPPAGGKRRK